MSEKISLDSSVIITIFKLVRTVNKPFLLKNEPSFLYKCVILSKEILHKA